MMMMKNLPMKYESAILFVKTTSNLSEYNSCPGASTNSTSWNNSTQQLHNNNTFNFNTCLFNVSHIQQEGDHSYYWLRRQSCVEAYAEDAQAPASSFRSEKEGSLSKV